MPHRMTKCDYYQRLTAYIIAAMLTQFIGDADALRDGDMVTVSIIIAKILLAGVIVWRAFIDQSRQFMDSPPPQISKDDKELLNG
jgi:hypothetical protein